MDPSLVFLIQVAEIVQAFIDQNPLLVWGYVAAYLGFAVMVILTAREEMQWRKPPEVL